MKNKLAFVLGGGGARGALQVGALRALLEAGLQPDILVGTSIGAVNAAYLAVHGLSSITLDGLYNAWRDATTANLLPSNYLWLTVRALFKRLSGHSTNNMREFFLAHGISTEICFGDIRWVKLFIVAADLSANRIIVYGNDPQVTILEALLASTALPPWVTPIQRNDQILMDGGAVSPLPIEPAMQAGASQIVALDITDPRHALLETHGFGAFLNSLIFTVGLRQVETELALAKERGVPVHHFILKAKEPVPIWDFGRTDELLETGYEIAKKELAAKHGLTRKGWWGYFIEKLQKSLRLPKSG